ncbi:MAG: N-acyl homoserine lactonase family protein [Methylocystaceae bacterium]|nr:N-acyl homoserine lactonase family protein [Methylocystaceae bacterium]
MLENKVFALRFATVERKLSDTFLGWQEKDGPIDLDFYFWVIKTESKIILVDTGFSENASKKRKRQYIHTPSEALQNLGISPMDVTDVIITHLHFDHAGNTDLFPNASFYLQEEEMAFATGKLMNHKELNHHIDIEDVTKVLELVYAGRVLFVNGDYEIAPGITIHLIAGHTPGIQSVRIETQRGPVIIASDSIHYYANYNNKMPFPGMADYAGKLEGYRKIRALTDHNDLIIPSHDPLVRHRYPKTNDQTDIVSLHLPPSSSYPLEREEQ